MAKDDGALNWGVERRLEFIEFKLFWEGHVNRGDLIDKFGISVNQASTDLNRYLGIVPDNMGMTKAPRPTSESQSLMRSFSNRTRAAIFHSFGL